MSCVGKLLSILSSCVVITVLSVVSVPMSVLIVDAAVVVASNARSLYVSSDIRLDGIYTAFLFRLTVVCVDVVALSIEGVVVVVQSAVLVVDVGQSIKLVVAVALTVASDVVIVLSVA